MEVTAITMSEEGAKSQCYFCQSVGTPFTEPQFLLLSHCPWKVLGHKALGGGLFGPLSGFGLP